MFWWRKGEQHLLPSSSGERSETGGPSGAEGDLHCKYGAWRFRPCGHRWVPRSAPLRGLPEDDGREGAEVRNDGEGKAGLKLAVMSKTTLATVALTQAGVAFELFPYDYDPDARRVGCFALSRAAGSPGLRREDAACRRMTEEGEHGRLG